MRPRPPAPHSQPSQQYFDLAAAVTAAQAGKAPRHAAVHVPHGVKEWAQRHRVRLTACSTALAIGPAGEILAVTGDGWKTAATLGVAGAISAGAWGWVPGLVKWNGVWRPARTLPGLRDRIIALSMPVTGSSLLTTMSLTGGPEWGDNPWWGFSLAWSIGYGTWWWRRTGRAPALTVNTPKLTEQMLIWEQYLATSDGAYPKSELVEPVATKNGWSSQVHVPRGKKFTMDPEAVASAYDVDVSLVAMERPAGGSPRRGQVAIMKYNPLQKGTLFGDRNVLDPDTGVAPIGVYYDGDIASYRFFRPGSGVVHSFITGTSDSGKSRLIDGLLGIERRSPLVASIVIDPQGGQSLPDWPEGVACFAPSPELGFQVLRAVKAIVDDRSARYGRLKWVDEKGRTRIGRAHFVPNDPDPIISLTLDEAHQVLMHEVYGLDACFIVADIAKRARKCGVKIRLANQSPNASELGGDTVIRDILQGGNNAVLRSGSSATGKRAAGTALMGVDPGSIPREFADGSTTGGLGYLAGPDGRTAMFRTAYVEDPYGLAQEGVTTPLEDACLRIPIVRHVLDEAARFLKCRQDGTQYTYDPASFDDETDQQTAAPAPARAATAPAKKRPAAAPPVSPQTAPPGTATKIVTYLARLGRPAAPATIAKALNLTGPQVRTCLKRMKNDPTQPITTLGHGAWIHTDHADEYTKAA
ncbi:hypothetical protein [Streptomyces sp. NPDC005407]|uniref:hypothetical protein n=1 Tax=Streptomyces sp. NPDC005407 TaxID=3155340 RepID=UPI0033B4E7CE